MVLCRTWYCTSICSYPIRGTELAYGVTKGGGFKSESLAWTAPEVLGHDKYSTCSDVYSFAVPSSYPE
eukprot:1282641-Rhodomonas_salina.4